jgi:phage-related protein
MPAIDVVFYQDEDGSVPLIDWLAELPAKARAKCIVLIELLQQLGPGLRRPHADFLRDGVYELRTHLGHVQYRLLYFFHGQTAVLSHGFIKPKAKVAPKEIDRAVAHQQKFAAMPRKHTHRKE